MKKLTTIALGLLIAILCLHFESFAQDKKEGKITIKITKEIDGEEKTFEREYDSQEAMWNDPEYHMFIGKDRKTFIFGFPDDEDVLIELKKLGEEFRYDFDIDQDFILDADSMSKELQKHLDELKNEFEGIIIHKENDEPFMWHSFDGDHVKIIEIHKHVVIEDIEGDELGKRGFVSKKDQLNLENLDFYPNPSKGRLKLKFTLPEEGPLDIKVFDLDGKEVYSRSFAFFGGTYNEYLDLTGQNEGMYLLEISSGKKRLTKKIIIE